MVNSDEAWDQTQKPVEVTICKFDFYLRHHVFRHEEGQYTRIPESAGLLPWRFATHRLIVDEITFGSKNEFHGFSISTSDIEEEIGSACRPQFTLCPPANNQAR